MKIFNKYKTENAGEQTGKFWLFLLQWLRLLVLSLSRIRDRLSGIFFHDPGGQKEIKKLIANKKMNNIKSSNMKSGNRIIKWAFMLLLVICSTANTFAQAPPSNPGPHTICLDGQSQPYGVTYTSGSSYSWSIIPAATNGATGTLTQNTTFPNLINITWLTAGTATLQVVETTGFGCVGSPVSIPITVNPLPTASITANNSPICSGSNATFTLTGTANAVVTYNINGAANQTVTLSAAGTATVTVTAAAANQTLNLVSVSLASTSCSQPLSGSSTVTVNPLPTTSAITHN
ncbi:MAG: hypothetical protein M3Y85_00900 [Bacteroidota bacterium]|nr:hypothetical protein [Bacteroidota bacterium]